MATVAGTVMGLYAGILAATVPAALSHILVASLISAPAALMLAAVMLPPEGDANLVAVTMQSPYSSSMDALVSGTGEGLRLLANIIGMLIVFVALVYLVDQGLALIPTGTGAPHSGRPIWTATGSAGMADRHTLERSPYCRGVIGHQGVHQRISSVSGTGCTGTGCTERTQPPDHDLRPLRLCEFWQPGHHDRRPDCDVPGTFGRYSASLPTISLGWPAGNLHDWLFGGPYPVTTRFVPNATGNHLSKPVPLLLSIHALTRNDKNHEQTLRHPH